MITKNNLKISDVYKDDLYIHSESKLSEFENDMAFVDGQSFNELSDKVEELKLFKFPNATIIGEPTIQNGQVSDFSTVSYLQFPFIVDLHNKAFEINFCFTTATNVQTQQNILDSKFGLALAIKDGKGLMAISSDGQSWNIGNTTGTMNIESNTTYYAKLTWDGIQYKTLLSTDDVSYTQDMVLVGVQAPHPTTIFIGGCDNLETGHDPHPFLGTINLNKATLSIMGQIVWQGMDDAGLATRLATDMSNIDEAGIEKVKEIAKESVESDLAKKVDIVTDEEKGIEIFEGSKVRLNLSIEKPFLAYDNKDVIYDEIVFEASSLKPNIYYTLVLPFDLSEAQILESFGNKFNISIVSNVDLKTINGVENKYVQTSLINDYEQYNGLGVKAGVPFFIKADGKDANGNDLDWVTTHKFVIKNARVPANIEMISCDPEVFGYYFTINGGFAPSKVIGGDYYMSTSSGNWTMLKEGAVSNMKSYKWSLKSLFGYNPVLIDKLDKSTDIRCLNTKIEDIENKLGDIDTLLTNILGE